MTGPFLSRPDVVAACRRALDTMNKPIRADDVVNIEQGISYTDALWTLRVMEQAGELVSNLGHKASGYAPVFSIRLDVPKMKAAGAL